MRGRAVPTRPTAEIEAEIATTTAVVTRQAEAYARAAAIRAALATGDPTPIREWARAWLTDTSTVDAADDASLMESARAANAAMTRGVPTIEDAAARVAEQLAALPTVRARERLLQALEASPRADALTRAMNRLIAAQARRLLSAPKVDAS